MNKKVCFTQDAFYFVKASTDAPGYPAPNGLASIYHQSEKAIEVPEKDCEVIDRRPNAKADTAFEVLVNKLSMLYKGARPVITDLPEPSEEKKRLDNLKAICKPIENQ